MRIMYKSMLILKDYLLFFFSREEKNNNKRMENFNRVPKLRHDTSDTSEGELLMPGRRDKQHLIKAVFPLPGKGSAHRGYHGAKQVA